MDRLVKLVNIQLNGLLHLHLIFTFTVVSIFEGLCNHRANRVRVNADRLGALDNQYRVILDFNPGGQQSVRHLRHRFLHLFPDDGFVRLRCDGNVIIPEKAFDINGKIGKNISVMPVVVGRNGGIRRRDLRSRLRGGYRHVFFQREPHRNGGFPAVIPAAGLKGRDRLLPCHPAQSRTAHRYALKYPVGPGHINAKS